MILAHTSTTAHAPWVAAALCLAAGVYVIGVVRRRRNGRRSDARRGAAFLAALVVLAGALVSPLDPLASDLFAAHMVQHLALIIVAAPLLVLARPMPLLLGALPPHQRRGVHRLVASTAVRARGRRLVHPVVAWVAATAVLWGWHLPSPYEAAVTYPLVHAVEHATLLATAALTWWLVLNRRGPSALARPGAVLLVFATAVQGAALGAVLGLASAPLYRVHLAGSTGIELTPLADQQLAGALMWGPPTTVYVTTMLVLLFRWFSELDARTTPHASRLGREARS